MPRWSLYLTALTCFAIVLILWNSGRCPYPRPVYLPEPLPRFDSPSSFEQFDNSRGISTGEYIVPNYLHFIRFGNGTMTYMEAICLLSAMKHHSPEVLYIHTDQTDFDDKWGKYWNLVKRQPHANKIDVRYRPQPQQIFGKLITGHWKSDHATNIAMLLVLMEYGGIFLENDSYVARNLDEFRRYEMTLGWPNGDYLSNKAIVAHKNARFLEMWFDSYKDYKSNEGFYNAKMKPTKEILTANPHLIHRVERLFVEVKGIAKLIYAQNNSLWRHHYVIHLSSDEYPFYFDEHNILSHEANIKYMALEVHPMESRH